MRSRLNSVVKGVNVRVVQIGICGLGTVGSGVYEILKRNGGLISSRANCAIEVTHVGARRDHPNCDTQSTRVSRDVFDVAKDPDIDIVVELIGGTSVAFDLVMMSINNGKHVVTANKALIAENGAEIFAAAAQRGVTVAYEAAVAGGIPIIKVLREGLAGNQINWLAGIINGTSNFILSEMASKQREFADVLKEAQEKGYAEADPTFDIEGVDAAHKLAILASIAFAMPLNIEDIYMEGITQLQPCDVTYAADLGYVIKHLGVARQTTEGVELRVHPTLVPVSCLLAGVNDALNAVMIRSDALGSSLFYGRGAGSEPTASSVIADIVDISRVIDNPPSTWVSALGCQLEALDAPKMVPMECVETCFYLRFAMRDTPGALSDATKILAETSISIEAIVQKEQPAGADFVDVIVVTDRVREAECKQAVSQIEALSTVHGSVVTIRLERLDD